MSRKDDLEQSIRESQDLIDQYQAIIRTSESPKAKARAGREIAEQRELIEGYQAELDGLMGDAWPHEAVEHGMPLLRGRMARSRSLWRRPKARLTGLVILLVALIMGLLFPKFLYSDLRCEVLRYIPGWRCYQVYADHHTHFFPSGYMGDIAGITFEETAEQVHSGRAALKIAYERPANGLGWAGQVWQFPAHNWGTFSDGYDLDGYRYVTFWARGTRPNQSVLFGIGGTGYRSGTCKRDPISPFPESLCPAVEVDCVLTEYWLRFAIPIPEDGDLHHIISGFYWKASKSMTFYLDDILWVENPAVLPWRAPLMCR